MKKAEFIKIFVQHREDNGAKQVKAGTVRLSEHVMGLASAPADAARIWAKHRATFAPMDRAQFYKFMGWDVAPPNAPMVEVKLDKPLSIVEQLDFTMVWHLEKALNRANAIHDEPIRSDLLLLRGNLQVIRSRLA